MRKVSNLLFYAGFAILTLKYTVATTADGMEEELGHIMVFVGALFLLGKALFSAYGQRKFYLIVIFGVLAVLSLGSTGDPRFVLIALALMSMQGIRFKKIIKVWLYVNILVFLMVVPYSIVTGDNLSVTQGFRIYEGVVTRYSFGYVHPNTVQCALMKIICGFLLLNTGMKRQWQANMQYIMLELINYIIFYYSDSKAGFLAGTFIIIGGWASVKYNHFFKKKVVLNAAYLLLCITIIGTIWAVATYGDYMSIVVLDLLASGRFSLAHRLLEETGTQLSMLGSNIDYNSTALIMDCGIVNSLYSDGIIIFLIITYAIYHGVYIFWQEAKYIEMIVVIGFTLYSVIEAVYSNLYLNLGLLLCLYELIWSKNVKEKKNVA